MSKESNFLIYCMERYRHFKGLSGADVAKTFEEYGICLLYTSDAADE